MPEITECLYSHLTSLGQDKEIIKERRGGNSWAAVLEEDGVGAAVSRACCLEKGVQVFLAPMQLIVRSWEILIFSMSFPMMDEIG